MTTCTWCDHNRTREGGQPGTHVVLFVCPREHFLALPICQACADGANQGDRYICRACTRAHSSGNPAPARIDLICTRAEWMAALDAGRVRFAREAVRT